MTPHTHTDTHHCGDEWSSHLKSKGKACSTFGGVTGSVFSTFALSSCTLSCGGACNQTQTQDRELTLKHHLRVTAGCDSSPFTVTGWLQSHKDSPTKPVLKLKAKGRDPNIPKHPVLLQCFFQTWAAAAPKNVGSSDLIKTRLVFFCLFRLWTDVNSD